MMFSSCSYVSPLLDVSVLSRTMRLPVIYVFGQQPVDVAHAAHEFDKLFPEKTTPVIVMCDVEYSYAVGMFRRGNGKGEGRWKGWLVWFSIVISPNIEKESLIARLSETYSTIIPTKIQTESRLQSTLDQGQREKPKTSCCGSESACCASVPLNVHAQKLESEKKNGGRFYELPKGVSVEDCAIFFIGSESLTLTNIMMVHNKCPVWYNTNVTSDIS